MNKQNAGGISWTDWTWNPVTGCTHGCHWCYARRINERFGRHFDPFIHLQRLQEPLASKVKPGAKVFTVSMGDLACAHETWVDEIIHVIKKRTDVTFQILTKDPRFYKGFEWPTNVWLGTSVDSIGDKHRVEELLAANKENIRWLAVCPALTADPEHIGLKNIRKLDWIVLEPLHHSTRRIRGRSEDLVRYWTTQWKNFQKVLMFVKGMSIQWENHPTEFPKVRA